MYSYIKGIVKEIDATYIVVENHGIGYLIYTANPYSMKKKRYKFIFINKLEKMRIHYMDLKQEKKKSYSYN